MKIFVVLVCCFCLMRSFISFFADLSDGIAYPGKPFILNLLLDAAVAGCTVLISVYACRYVCLVSMGA